MKFNQKLMSSQLYLCITICITQAFTHGISIQQWNQGAHSIGKHAFVLIQGLRHNLDYIISVSVFFQK